MNKKIKNRLVEGVDWYGVLAILLAYGLVSFGIVLPQSWTYQILNATGAGGIIYGSLHKKDYQPAVLNIVWLLIAAVAIINLIL